MAKDKKDTKVDATKYKTIAAAQNTVKPISFFKLFRYCQALDIFLAVIGVLCSLGTGLIAPLSSLLMGDITDDMGPNSTMDDFIGQAKKFCGYFFALGGGGFIVATLGIGIWMYIGERQTLNIRRHYFRAMMHQEIAYFDSVNPNEFSTKIANDCHMIYQGIGEKIHTFVQGLSLTIGGYVIAFTKGWKLSAIMLGSLPLTFIGGGLFVWSMQVSNKVSMKAYEKSGGIAEQALAAIKTVVALGGEEKEKKDYKDALDASRYKVIAYGFVSGLCIGILIFGIFFTYFLGLHYGSQLVHDQEWNSIPDRPYNLGDVLTILFSLMMGSFGLTAVTNPLKSFAQAKHSGSNVMAIIDRPSKINASDPSGVKPQFRGRIEFKNVEFAYPGKPDKQILKGISLVAEPGQKVAFVGESGCGKTTGMQLIERFYDTDAGEILFDGVPIKSINIQWLRENIGYVGQEPALFDCSIRDNMKFAKKTATDDEIWRALKAVNMDVFVSGLTKKLDTHVGGGGGQLSGGQKQRLAIARAVLKDPKILLLDEATSALDRKNEVEIQATLDKISKERTTIVIAHRLSTIQNADVILCYDKGHIAERGTHEQLLAMKGVYYNLILHQMGQIESEEKKKQETGNDEIPAVKPVQRKASHREEPVHYLTGHQRDELKAFRHPGDGESDGSEEGSPVPEVKEGILSRIPSQIQAMAHDNSMNIVPGIIPSVEAGGQNFVAGDNIHHTQEEKTHQKKKYTAWQVIQRLTAYTQGQRLALFGSYLVPMLNGANMTCVGVILAHFLEVMLFPDDPEYESKSKVLSDWLLICGAITVVILMIERGIQATVAERITTGLRVDVFGKLLRMHMGFFDMPNHSPGSLAGKLAADATQVNALITNVANLVMVGAGGLLSGIIMAFVGDWKLALVGMGLLPFLLLGSKFHADATRRFTKEADDAYIEANGYLSEILNNMRTVASFAQEDETFRVYDRKLRGPSEGFAKKSFYAGASLGYFQFIMMGTVGVLFVVGAYFMRDHGLTIRGLFLVLMGIMNGAQQAGNTMQALPEAQNALVGCEGFLEYLDTPSEIDIADEAGKITKPIQGNFEFIDVSFKYPTRDQYVLKNFNLKVSAGNKVAFVGSSGCGKSTVIQLILRFYNPTSGTILLDGVELHKYNLKHLRRSLGVVSQEPVLFNGTIEENIKYSRPDATDAEMREAAAQANALKFIENDEFDDIVAGGQDKDFGKGFHRKVGPKGSQMSGGQKQRIAIARAIIKKPLILLLDEATSALDSQSESIVQESLDKIMLGKTSIAIAHRISTIRDAKELLVFDRGVVTERGSYEELVRAQGMFYRLEKGL